LADLEIPSLPPLPSEPIPPLPSELVQLNSSSEPYNPYINSDVQASPIPSNYSTQMPQQYQEQTAQPPIVPHTSYGHNDCINQSKFNYVQNSPLPFSQGFSTQANFNFQQQQNSNSWNGPGSLHSFPFSRMSFAPGQTNMQQGQMLPNAFVPAQHPQNFPATNQMSTNSFYSSHQNFHASQYIGSSTGVQVVQSGQASCWPTTTTTTTVPISESFQAPEPVTNQPSKHCFDSLATTVEANTLFSSPGRSNRPPLLAVILRGLPGSGKTRVAQAIRDAEVDNGAPAPKIHSLDDYFMTEIERVIVQDEKQGNGTVVKRKKQVTEMEYVYEAEMEASYCASLLKGLTRTADERRFKCIVGNFD